MITAPEDAGAYRPRLIDESLRGALASAGAVVLEGARATGKTRTALHASASHVYLDDAQVQQTLAIAPRSLLEGAAPRLLDEWQLAPELWNLVRRAVDASAAPGSFILTGSAVPADDATRHTGAGRFIRLRQRTMTWSEKLATLGTVSIGDLLNGGRPQADMGQGLDLESVIDHLLRPGFPAMIDLAPAQSAARLLAYIDDISRSDVRQLADVRHQPGVIKQLIAALARSVASDVTYATLASDVRSVAPTINAETVSTYVGLLERLFVVEAQQPWTPKLRSRARLRMSPKLHLVDPALAAAALGAGPERLRSDLHTLGTLFESAVVHDLQVLVAALGAEVRHYRDSNGKEIDAIVSLPDGRWGAVEVKLGGAQVPAAIESLQKVVSQIDTASVSEPSFRLVVTGTGQIFTADDGTVTAPLHALAP